MSELHAYCDQCDRCILPLSHGLIEVSMAEVNRVEAARQSWRAERGQGLAAPDGRPSARAYSGTDLLDYPEAATWHVWHRTCDPDPDEEASPYYHVGLERIADAADLLHWTAHLMEKSWLEHTNWRELIGRAANGHGSLRCVGQARRAP
jgi:hypothetical protein